MPVNKIKRIHDRIVSMSIFTLQATNLSVMCEANRSLPILAVRYSLECPNRLYSPEIGRTVRFGHEANNHRSSAWHEQGKQDVERQAVPVNVSRRGRGEHPTL
jgi:hypothetical protein